MDGRWEDAFAVINESTSSPGYGESNRLLKVGWLRAARFGCAVVGLQCSARPISCRASLEEIQTQNETLLDAAQLRRRSSTCHAVRICAV